MAAADGPAGLSHGRRRGMPCLPTCPASWRLHSLRRQLAALAAGGAARLSVAGRPPPAAGAQPRQAARLLLGQRPAFEHHLHGFVATPLSLEPAPHASHCLLSTRTHPRPKPIHCSHNKDCTACLVATAIACHKHTHRMGAQAVGGGRASVVKQGGALNRQTATDGEGCSGSQRLPLYLAAPAAAPAARPERAAPAPCATPDLTCPASPSSCCVTLQGWISWRTVRGWASRASVLCETLRCAPAVRRTLPRSCPLRASSFASHHGAQASAVRN